MLSLVLCYLLVCEIPMFSFKFKSLKWEENKSRFIFLALSAILAITTAVMGFNWSVLVLAIFTSYIIINLCHHLKG